MLNSKGKLTVQQQNQCFGRAPFERSRGLLQCPETMTQCQEQAGTIRNEEKSTNLDGCSNGFENGNIS